MGTNQILKQKHEVPLLEPTTLKVLCKSQPGTLPRKWRRMAQHSSSSHKVVRWKDLELKIAKLPTNVIMFASWRESDVFKFSIRLEHFTLFDREERRKESIAVNWRLPKFSSRTRTGCVAFFGAKIVKHEW